MLNLRLHFTYQPLDTEGSEITRAQSPGWILYDFWCFLYIHVVIVQMLSFLLIHTYIFLVPFLHPFSHSVHSLFSYFHRLRYQSWFVRPRRNPRRTPGDSATFLRIESSSLWATTKVTTDTGLSKTMQIEAPLRKSHTQHRSHKYAMVVVRSWGVKSLATTSWLMAYRPLSFPLF